MIRRADHKDLAELLDTLRAAGVGSFEYRAPGDQETFRISFLLDERPAAAQPSTPEQTGNTGAQEPDKPKTQDVFDVIETQRAPGAPGPDGLPVAGSAG